MNSETDFVARNDLFQGLVKMIANVALGTGPDVDKILAAKAGTITIAEAIADTIAKIGENMTLRRAAELSVGKGVVASYVHSSVADGLGRIGVLVALEIDRQRRRVQSLRPDVGDACRGRQSAGDRSVRPRSRDRSSARRACSPPRPRASRPTSSRRSSSWGFRTYYKEVCLLEQGYAIEEGKKPVAQAIKEAEAKVGAPIKVTGFVRFGLGEGIDRPSAISAAKSRRWPVPIKAAAFAVGFAWKRDNPIAFARESAASGKNRKRTPRWLSRTIDG